MNALEYLAQGRVNVELLTHMGSDNILYLGIRLRPWKQDMRRPVMYIAQGLDLTDALNNVAKQLYYDKSEALDYRRRPWDAYPIEGNEAQTVLDLDFLDARPSSTTPKALQRTKASRELPITLLEPS